MNAEVKKMPEYCVAYVRKMGAYGKETCEQAFGELMQWAGPRGYLASGAMLGLYWDNPEVTPPVKCRTDACISVPAGTVPEGQIGLQTISGGPYAVCHFEIKTDSFQQAWLALCRCKTPKGAYYGLSTNDVTVRFGLFQLPRIPCE